MAEDKKAVALRAESAEGISLLLYSTGIEQATGIAKVMLKANLVPLGLIKNKKPEEAEATVAICIVHGRDLGFTPLQSVANMMVANQKASPYGSAALSLIRQHKNFGWMKMPVFGRNEHGLYCSIEFMDKSVGESQTVTMYASEFQHLIDDPKKPLWKTALKDMLGWKVYGRIERQAFPEALMGMGIYEDVQYDSPNPNEPLVIVPGDQPLADEIRGARFEEVIPEAEEPEEEPAPSKEAEVDIDATPQAEEWKAILAEKSQFLKADKLEAAQRKKGITSKDVQSLKEMVATREVLVDMIKTSPDKQEALDQIIKTQGDKDLGNVPAIAKAIKGDD